MLLSRSLPLIALSFLVTSCGFDMSDDLFDRKFKVKNISATAFDDIPESASAQCSPAAKITSIMWGSYCGRTELEFDREKRQFELFFSTDFLSYMQYRITNSCPPNSEFCECYGEGEYKECYDYEVFDGGCEAKLSFTAPRAFYRRAKGGGIFAAETRLTFLEITELDFELTYIDSGVEETVVTQEDYDDENIGFLSKNKRAKMRCETFGKILESYRPKVFVEFKNDVENRVFELENYGVKNLKHERNVLDGERLKYFY